MYKQRVIHIALGKVNPNRMNGVNKVVHGLATAQINSGAEVEFWGITKNPVHNYDDRVFMTKLFKDKGRFKLDKTLIKEIKQCGGNTIFHLHGAFNTQIALVGENLRRNGIPYVFTPHGAYNIIAMQKNSFVKKIYIKLFEKSLLKGAKSVHVIGTSEKYGLGKIYEHKSVVLIPNGHKFSNTSPKKKTQNEVFTIGFLGRIDINTKGLDIFCEALRIIKKKEIKLIWEITGKNGDINTLKDIIKNFEIEDYVKFNGALFSTDKEDFLRRIDFLCLNSRNEGLPGVVLESFEQGTPVIVSKETNFGDYVAKYNCGIVLNSNEPNDLVDCLLEASTLKNSDSLYSKLSSNVIETLNDKFTWTSIARQMKELYA